MAEHRKVPAGRVGRFARLAATGARLGAARLLGGEKDRTLEHVADALGTLRGLAAKVGQMASYVDGVIDVEQDEAVARTLAALRAAAPSSAPAAVRSLVEQELDGPLEELFDEWEEEPFASASIGQVHRARLLDGREVAVKVQHPGMAQAIEADLANAGMLERVLGTMVGRQFHSKDLLEQARQRFREELDYRLEATNQRAFADVHHGDADIVVPAVVDSRSARRVLTTELATGRDFEQACAAPARERRRWAETLWRYVFRAALQGGLFNADPHPGNYLFQEDGRIVFLDFGCVQGFSPKRHVAAVAVHRAAVAKDEEAFYEAALEFLEPRPGRHAELAVAFKRQCFEPLFASPFRMTRGYVAELVAQLKASALEARKLPPDEVGPLPEGVLFMNRLQFGFYSVLARLDVEIDYSAAERPLLAGAEAAARARLTG